MKRKWLIATCVAAVTLTCLAKANAGPSKDPGAIAVDVLIGRPACLVATIVGSAVFVISLPVAATTGSIDSAAEALVVKPARATFVRPLGEFGEGESYAAQNLKSKRLAHSTKKHRHSVGR